MNATQPVHDPPEGAQRLSLARLKEWEALGYGMFIHFGLGTFGSSFPTAPQPSALYAPDRLDVEQWVRVARDAGMRYAVLTAKHVTGHCLWPSAHTDYHVGTSGNPTDVVAAFVAACRRYDIVPGLYYCSWDTYHRFGSLTPDHVDGGDQMRETIWNRAFTTAEYRAFQMAQIEELLTRYGPIGEVWIDIPHLLTADGRRKQYAQVAALCPDAVVMMNTGFGDGMLGQGQDGRTLDVEWVWPTDLISMETSLPSTYGYTPWFKLGLVAGDARDYYIPGEVAECIDAGGEWFPRDGHPLRSDGELLGLRLLAQARHANLLLNVPPDSHGVIPQPMVDALMRLRENVDRLAL